MAKGDNIGSATGALTDKLRAGPSSGMQQMAQIPKFMNQGMMQPNQNMMQPGMQENSGMFGNMMPPQQGIMQQPQMNQGLAGSGLMDHIRNLFDGQQQANIGTGKGGLWF